nr:RbsD/FucU domain-containing protein [uncultured Gellertiella sp.]
MLKGISPLLDADLLHALRAMGHGDVITIVDTNFPADAFARSTVLGRPLKIGCSTAAEAVSAILALMPLDTFVEDAAVRMEVVGAPDEVPEVQREVQAAINQAAGQAWPLVSLERYAFYAKARSSYCIVQTGERRFYGCAAFTMGVLPPDA